ncbi:MAG: glycoside hydrolase family 127 protein [Clostridia bacterium]|nr:glycoside hydrolase family 127 protein [Clostridia bacterium]
MKPIFNRAPLTPNTLTPLPLGSIRPEDWLLKQLQTQRDGLTAKLDEVCPEIGPGCGWLGGEGDSGERAPYYLDGLIALAWTLDDEALKQKATAYVEWILSSQREDGWFGPAQNRDYWPLMLALRALRQYFMATNDRRVLVLMDRFFKYQYLNLNDHPLSDWAVARGGENMELALWLYNITGQKHLLELCRKLRGQTLDWPNYFHTFSNTVPMSKSLKWERLDEALREEKNEPLLGEKRPYFHTQYHLSHGVNIAMGLKTPGVINLFKSGFKEQGGFRFGWAKLVKHHGVASGMFICDEHLNGNSPTQGSELSAVAELMVTLQTLLGLGDFNAEYADLLEKLAFNALPAGFNADMTACQRTGQVNQVKISREQRKWYNNGDDANLYGASLEGVSCHQAWPKFAASLWYATVDGGLQAVSYAPCTVRTVLDNVPVRLRVSGGYPFAQSVQIQVSVKQPCEFPLYLRMPFWTRQPMVFLPDGEIMQVRAGDITCVRRRWRSGDVLRLELNTVPRITKWYHQSGAVELGPLLMALQPEEAWERQPDGEWQVTAQSPWNWALVRDEPMKAVYTGIQPSAFGKGEAPVKVLVKAAPVEWHMEGGSCASVPMVPAIREESAQVIELVPFGGTCLRIGQFPLGRGKTRE